MYVFNLQIVCNRRLQCLNPLNLFIYFYFDEWGGGGSGRWVIHSTLTLLSPLSFMRLPRYNFFVFPRDLRLRKLMPWPRLASSGPEHSGKVHAPRSWGRSFKSSQVPLNVVWTKAFDSVLIDSMRFHWGFYEVSCQEKDRVGELPKFEPLDSQTDYSMPADIFIKLSLC